VDRLGGATVTSAWSAREAYQSSLAQVLGILKLFGLPKADSNPILHTEAAMTQIKTLLKQIYDNQKQEEMNEYRRVIIDIVSWIGSGYNTAFVERVAKDKPNILYVARKGLEVLHVLLARDLRRRNLTLSEKQAYADFRDLAARCEDPRKVAQLKSAQS
jgi:hypothetical protein